MDGGPETGHTSTDYKIRKDYRKGKKRDDTVPTGRDQMVTTLATETFWCRLNVSFNVETCR